MLPGFSLNLALPDLWQQEAVRHLRSGADVIVDAPTGAGKTRIFEMIAKGGGLGGQSIYTVPTRALANDKLHEWRRENWKVGISTGDVSENVDAPVVVATLETQRERFLAGQGPRLLVVDEYQMLADPVRGLNYELCLAMAPLSTSLLLLSGSVANAKDVAAWLTRLGRRVEVVTTKDRPVPLDEMPDESLPKRGVTRNISGFWPKLAAEVLTANLGPLLIFAPQRHIAEKIARQIAQAVPTPDPLQLSEKQEHILGAGLAPLLRQRVAFHHSGLSYLQRAGVIEPLAKAGQLRVVVATMGLAAGIDFSMRSVVVTDPMFFDGKMERKLAPDELLQMFGRAGRRGKDEVGYVVTTNRSPRLADAAQKHLRRSNQVDWPNLLRIMQKAAEAGADPLAAAEKLCESLFSKQQISLGFETASESEQSPSGKPTAATPRHASGVIEGELLFGLEPTRTEVYNSKRVWEVKLPHRVSTAALGQSLIIYQNHVDPALQVHPYMSENFPVGRICRLQRASGHWFYGKEFPLAMERKPRVFQLTKNIREWLSVPAVENFSYDQLEDRILPQLTPWLCGGRVFALTQRGEILMVQVDFSKVEVEVYFDLEDQPLIDPEEREVKLHADASLRTAEGKGTLKMPKSNTAAYAWRKLGLIEADGRPTRRGQVFSFFQGGEGLAIAAALEQESYPVSELVLHIANLRGTQRFSDRKEMEGGGSERLSAACLGAYGAANYEGYLELGLPVAYGEGIAELLLEIINRPQRRRELTADDFGEGDLERAVVEWLSLLRQIANAPTMEWHRWSEFQAACSAERQKHQHLLPSRDLPPVPAAQLSHQPNHTQIAVH